MKDDFEYARLAAQALARRPNEPRAGGVDRDRGIGSIAQAIAEAGRRRRRALWLKRCSWVAAAASIVAAAGWIGHQHGSSTAAFSQACGEGVPCSASALGTLDRGHVSGRPFEPGQSIVAGRGTSAVVEFASGTRISVEQQGELEYREGDDLRRFGLLRGSAQLRVSKLKPGQRFVVQTPDSEIEVRGTTFSVAVAPADELCGLSRTRVAVDEGVVEVRFQGSKKLLAAGAQWPAQCAFGDSERVGSVSTAESVEATPLVADIESLPIEQSAERLSSARNGARKALRNKRGAASSLAAPIEEESPLSQQNDLYAQAVAARREGSAGEALAIYEQLTRLFPSGPLGESAVVERMRMLKSIDRAQARAEARRYLARYPRGFARSEAQAVLLVP